MALRAPSVETALVDDAARVMRDLKALGSLLQIKTKAGGLTTLAYPRWHPEQRAFHAARCGRDLVLKARQVGFTTLELARDVQYARTRAGVQVLVVSHDGELAETMFQAAHMMVGSLVELGLCPKPKYSTRREIVFADNHSAIRVVEAGATDAAANKKGRSGTINRLHATEIAFWGAAQSTMAALMNAVPQSGEIIIESTANGAAGLFYDLCRTALEGKGEFKLHFYPWHVHEEYRTRPPPDFDPHPRDVWEERLRDAGCDDAQIAWWRSRVDDPARGGIELVLQENPIDPHTCFRTSGGAYIPSDSIEWLQSRTREPLRRERIIVKGRYLGDLAVWAEPVKGERYVVGGDVSEGIGGDASAADVSIARTGQTVATFANDKIEPGDFGIALAWIGRRYNHAMLACERNKDGAAAIRALTHEATEVTPYPQSALYVAEDGRIGWLTSTATRPQLFDELRTVIVDLAQRRDPLVLTPCIATVDEAKTLVRDPVDGKPRARGKGTKGGARDDRFVAKAIGWQVRQAKPWSPKPFHIPNL